MLTGLATTLVVTLWWKLSVHTAAASGTVAILTLTFDPHVRLLQPRLPTLVGHRAFRERFARPLFALIPDLHGQVERTATSADCASIELTLRSTLGGRPIAWRVCDRATPRDGLVVERESYFDPLPLLRAIRTSPRAWPALTRAPMGQRRHRATRRDKHDATTGRPPAPATDDQRTE
jgi:ketosteroid isomerase-like protein